MTCPRHLSPGKEILLLSASHWGLAGMHPGVGPPPDVFRGGWGAVPPCRAGSPRLLVNASRELLPGMGGRGEGLLVGLGQGPCRGDGSGSTPPGLRGEGLTDRLPGGEWSPSPPRACGLLGLQDSGSVSDRPHPGGGHTQAAAPGQKKPPPKHGAVRLLTPGR